MSGLDLFGMRLMQSPLCERTVPVRKHKRRRGQTEAYHRRVQKKWTKRWGTRTERVAYILNTRALGLAYAGRADLLMLHPSDFAAIRNFD